MYAAPDLKYHQVLQYCFFFPPQILRSCLATAQDDVTSLLEEKRSLLDRVQHLQDLVEQSQRSKR